MLPLLYNSNTTPQKFFDNNGLGFIKNSTKCIASEERNGKYELDLEVLTSDRLSSCIVPGMFVKAKANPHDDPQIFEIYQTSADDKKITAKGRHLRYIAYGNAFRILYDAGAGVSSAATPQEIFDEILTPAASFPTMLLFDNNFELYSDIETKNYVHAGEQRLVRFGEFLQGIKGSMLDVFGGEFRFDNFRIELLKNPGSDTGIAIRYGSNISSYHQDSDISTVYTHLLPYAVLPLVLYEVDKDKATLGERTLYSYSPIELVNTSLTYKRALPYDFSEKFTEEHDHIHFNTFGGAWLNESELLNKLQTEAEKYIRENQTALTDRSVNITIDVAATLNTLRNCHLCDTVKVCFEPLGFTTNAKIIKTEYDCLNERYTKLELGTVKKNISDLFDGKNIGGA